MAMRQSCYGLYMFGLLSKQHIALHGISLGKKATIGWLKQP